MAGKLYVVATPIGNLDELSPRAVEVLKSVDRIACEDTRTSGVLLRRFDIDTQLIACHKFNESAATAQLIDTMLDRRDVALISDAGTPGVSDPGAILVAAAVGQGIEVLPVTGSCALIAALSISGYGELSFGFYGFLPKENKKIVELLNHADGDYCPISIFYLSPHRLQQTLKLIAAQWPDAMFCLCNDLTKLHEKTYRGSPQAVIDAIAQNPKADRGEYVLIVRKPPRREQAGQTLSYEAQLIDDIAHNGGTLKDAVARLANQGLPRNILYDASVRVKDFIR